MQFSLQFLKKKMNGNQSLPPGSTAIVDLPGYPGGTNYLSDRNLISEGINKQFKNSANASVNITVKSACADGQGSAEAINLGMIAFTDNRKFDKPTITSLQEINSIIYQKTMNDERVPGSTEVFGANEQTRDWIDENYKLLGVVVNTDEGKIKNGNFRFGKERRVFTITVSGDCQVYNYWSTQKKKCKPYTKCYMVLKLVRLSKTEQFVTKVCGANLRYNSENEDFEDVWQFVPYCVHDRAIDRNDAQREGLFETSGFKTVIYQLGYIHEYATISHKSHFERRGDTHAVAKDVNLITGYGTAKPFQFYMNIVKY